MAIVRCEQCGKPTQNVKPPGYPDSPHLPVGGSNSALVCGKKHCENAGLVWLKPDEEEAYLNGERIFSIHTQTAKIKLL